MKKKQKLELYNKGNIPALISLMITLHRDEPEVFMNEVVLHHRMAKTWTQLNNPEKCPNCGASMKGYIYQFDYHDVKLLQAMGAEVRRRLGQGYSFTEANKINVSKIDCDYTAKSKKTQASKLGLIAQYTFEGKRIPSVWVITERGFKALRGEAVPKRVKVHRNKIQDRFEGDMITIQEILSRSNEGFTPDEWYEATGPVQGKML